MKISLFIKSSITKVSFLLLIPIFIAGMPSQANAGFFSNLIGVFSGNDQSAQAYQPVEATPTDDGKVYNSQTLPLLESSVNPDMKNTKDTQDLSTVEDGALVSNNGPLGPSMNLEKYASSAKINVYKVKKGDTLEGIAKKFKISKEVLLYSNAELKDKDLLKIGQSLTIFAVKDDIKEDAPEVTVKKEEPKVVTKQPEKVEKADSPSPLPVQEVEPVKIVEETQPIFAPIAPITTIIPVVSEPALPATPTGKPDGTITGDYIWPFPEGVGRVSQGLHADQAYDFAAPKGTPIYAVQSGKILLAKGHYGNSKSECSNNTRQDWYGGYGCYVVIDFNDGRQAILSHMSKVIAKAGDIVKQGDIIGYVGSTGRSTGPHVHMGFHGTLSNPYIGLKLNSRDLQTND